MPRIRTIKPDTWTDTKFGALGLRARLLFIALWNFADDAGRFIAHPAVVRSQCFPFDELSTEDTLSVLGELETAGMVRLYEVNGEAYGDVPHFGRHQRINKPQEPKYPAYPEDSGNGPGTVPEGSPTEGKGKEGKGKEGKGAKSESDAGASETPASLIKKTWSKITADTDWPSVAKMAGGRLGHARARVGDAGSWDAYEAALRRATRSNFLTNPEVRNRNPKHGDWRPDFDWLHEPLNFAKLLEGKYDDRESPTPDWVRDAAARNGEVHA